MLASDLNNPEFVGAQDPNKLLYVEFYMHEPEDGNKPWENGKPVRMPAIPYVKIMVPGNKNSEVDTPVREDHKQRFPEKWMYFLQTQQNAEGGNEIPGWKVDEWDQLTADQIRDLKYLRFYTVEQIAGASDAQVQKLGMGGLGLRERARQAVRQKLGAEESSALAKKDAEIADMKSRMEKLEALLKPQPAAQLMQVLPLPPQPETVLTTNAPTERDALVAQYVAKFGKKPHHKLGVEKIKAALGE